MKISSKKGNGYAIAYVSLIKINSGSLFDNKYQNLKVCLSFNQVIPFLKDIIGC